MSKIQPFANYTDFMCFQEQNCLNCTKYENESCDVDKAGCKLAFCLDRASVLDGLIDEELANEYGIKDFYQDKCERIEK